MRKSIKFLIAIVALVAVGCGGQENKSTSAVSSAEIEEDLGPASTRITLEDKGVGQITSVSLDAEVNQEMVAAGKTIYDNNCTACHKLDKRFIGPSPRGIMERRSPEWIMNMILDPQLMTEQDRCAKDLLIEFNGAAMANQNLTVDETRSILEYFRTL